MGPLPYVVQTVRTAGRYSVKPGLDANPDCEMFVSDLFPLAGEGVPPQAARTGPWTGTHALGETFS
eukprot:4940409-Pyramimonas_sp.AAC.1